MIDTPTPLRVLFVVPPLTGHVNPTVGVGLALQALGHEVAWLGHPGRVRPLLPPGATLLPLDDSMSEAAWSGLTEKTRSVRGLESLAVLWEDVLVPLARSMLPGVLAALDAWKPDIVIADQQAIAGALAARIRRIPFATSCTTSAGIIDPLSGLPKVRGWVDGQLAALEREAGLPPTSKPDLSNSLVLVFSTREFVGDAAPSEPRYVFVGPSTESRPDPTPFPWGALTPELPRVYVSLGTVSGDAGASFYAVVAEALGPKPMQVILSAPPELLPSPPQNFIVQRRVPQLALLEQVNAVVTHGGHNTVCEALLRGLPLVVAPIRDDQPVIADQVVRAGAGVRIRFGRTNAATFEAAVHRALTDDSLRGGASRIAESFKRAGGSIAAARAIVQLADSSSIDTNSRA